MRNYGEWCLSKLDLSFLSISLEDIMCQLYGLTPEPPGEAEKHLMEASPGHIRI